MPPPTAEPAVQLMLALGGALAFATAVTRGRAWQRQVSGWWRLMPVVFAAWWLRPLGLWALVMLIGALALRELAPHAAQRAPQLRRLLASSWALQAALGWWSPALAATAAALGGLGMAWWLRRHGPAQGLLAALFGLQAVGLWCLPLLADGEVGGGVEPAWCLYACCVTALNDVGQFVSGKRWGRHALARRISPNKTWQGAAGGLVMSLLASLAVGRTLGLADVPTLLALGLLLCVSGLAGDLLFSAAKRALGLKDFSALIPGHGGILDRVDSLVLTAPSLWLALHLL